MSYLKKNLNRMTRALASGFSDPNFAEANAYFLKCEKYLSLRERSALGEAWRNVYTDGAAAVSGVDAVVKQIVADRDDFYNSTR